VSQGALLYEPSSRRSAPAIRDITRRPNGHFPSPAPAQAPGCHRRLRRRPIRFRPATGWRDAILTRQRLVTSTPPTPPQPPAVQPTRAGRGARARHGARHGAYAASARRPGLQRRSGHCQRPRRPRPRRGLLGRGPGRESAFALHACAGAPDRLTPLGLSIGPLGLPGVL
jgi:hypothetical protein